jgi:hypothetical protein
MKIQSHDLLATGTPVQVKNRRGIVISAEYVRAVPCGFVALHTIKYTHKRKILCMNRQTWEPIKPITQTCNYAFINTI